MKGGALKSIKVLTVSVISSVFPGLASAAWTPLITSTDFVGISTDVQTVAAGIIGIMIIVVGIGILVRVLGR